MTVKELILELLNEMSKGYGDIDIFVEDGQEMCDIDGIAKNTHPDVKPEYLFIMPGDRKDESNE